jgi:hypothetical protein
MEGTVNSFTLLVAHSMTVAHNSAEDIAFHVALDHPETTSVVFVTGKRDFTYCAQTLRGRCVRVVVLVQNRQGDIVQANADKYWPFKVPVKRKLEPLVRKKLQKQKQKQKKCWKGQRPRRLSKAKRERHKEAKGKRAGI